MLFIAPQASQASERSASPATRVTSRLTVSAEMRIHLCATQVLSRALTLHTEPSLRLSLTLTFPPPSLLQQSGGLWLLLT